MIIAFNQVPAADDSGYDPAYAVLPSLLLETFRSCDRDSVVYGSMFHWSDEDFTEQLGRVLDKRPLRLRIVAGDSTHPFDDVIQAFFDEYVEQGGVFRKRPFGRRRNHDKWFLFEKLDWQALAGSLPAGAVVVGKLPTSTGQALYISTGNLSGADRDKNNAAVGHGDVPVGNAVRVHWGTRDQWAPSALENCPEIQNELRKERAPV